MSRARAAIILAAGQGKRMKSETPKMLHKMGGRPLVDWSIALARELNCARTVVVIPPNAPALAERVTSVLGEGSTAIQDVPRGTGDAARAAASVLSGFEGSVVVYFGDTPLIRTETLSQMFTAREAGADVVVLAFHADDPTGYGRIITDAAGNFLRNVEHRDANKEELAVNLCNAGALVADAKVLFDLLSKLRNDNAQQEFYLTDIPGMARTAAMKVSIVEARAEELLGVNSRAQLADAEAAFQARAREAAMEAGVTLIDPATVFFSYDTVIEQDAVIEPNVFFGTGVKICRGATIHAYCHFERTEVGPNSEIGPFARFRPGAKLAAKVKIGNFVEVKNSNFGEGAKASHLAYIGDADVGPRANIGAGTIVCNYDGFDKYRSTIGADAFIGSDTALVSPVTIGNGAYTGTGSVITKDVPDGALGVARGRQVNLEGWATKNKEKKLAAKAAKKDEHK
ncbi:bifunctional UDP-N-acetylglucosamine diphosphorylase/glucosamine-1-phosphate N-acetyltransferase GlmU [Candidatus Viadribacter manganicus]|uniref:Bifunctional protein GlmU n=1 Tax=Candidatus Viadribacter manganicus TaxID=1759059 RepID=A0A1B1AM18_9PROT|nr:bifunctional UDP-N-acetylglucosamine diphosphorylase/glucosamine-1-phosphate N-acetyltransferase GlmU [Candidatus Viadribacter manganicus]ANP47594.1 bifunctional N-acetylglucosamine-1-phosphate uridyltransferase/glucosamine-1-phosphate acetyltransferase [Candidatus Viadribacter manganicus]